MKNKLVSCLVFLCLMSGYVYSQPADTIYLNDGQVLSGKLLGWKKGIISFGVNSGGKMDVPFALVQKLVAQSQLFEVHAAGKPAVSGFLLPAAAKQLNVGTIDTTALYIIPFAEIITIIPEHSLVKSVSGSISAGASYNRSSDVGLINIDAPFTYRHKKYWLTTAVNSTMSLAHKKIFRDRENVVINGFRSINEKWYWSTRITYLRSREQYLSARYLTAGGLMYYFLNKPNAQWYAFTGLVYSGERTFDKKNRDMIEVPVLMHYDLQTWKKANVTLSTDHTLYLGMNNHKRIRHDGDVRLSWGFTRALALSVYVYDNYDSKTLSASGRSLDFGWSFGLKFSY